MRRHIIGLSILILCLGMGARAQDAAALEEQYKTCAKHYIPADRCTTEVYQQLKVKDNAPINPDVAFVLDGIKGVQSSFYNPSSMQVRFAYIEDAGEKAFRTLVDGPVACFELAGQNQYGGMSIQRYSYYRTLNTKHPEKEKLKFDAHGPSSSGVIVWPWPCVSFFSNKLHPGHDLTAAVIQALQNGR
jgi:hypothetical protein